MVQHPRMTGSDVVPNATWLMIGEITTRSLGMSMQPIMGELSTGAIISSYTVEISASGWARMLARVNRSVGMPTDPPCQTSALPSSVICHWYLSLRGAFVSRGEMVRGTHAMFPSDRRQKR